MRKYLVERYVPKIGALTQADLQQVFRRAKDALDEMAPRVLWVHSYVTQDRLYCIYLADDEGTVREHAQRGGFPCVSVQEIVGMLDPTRVGDDPWPVSARAHTATS